MCWRTMLKKSYGVHKSTTPSSPVLTEEAGEVIEEEVGAATDFASGGEGLEVVVSLFDAAMRSKNFLSITTVVCKSASFSNEPRSHLGRLELPLICENRESTRNSAP